MSAVSTQTSLRLLFQRERMCHDITIRKKIYFKKATSQPSVKKCTSSRRSSTFTFAALEDTLLGATASARTASGEGRQGILISQSVSPPAGDQCGRRPRWGVYLLTGSLLLIELTLLTKVKTQKLLLCSACFQKEKPL